MKKAKKGTRKRNIEKPEQVSKATPPLKENLTIPHQILIDEIREQKDIRSIFTGKKINWLNKKSVLLGQGTYGVVLRYDLPEGSVAVKFLQEQSEEDVIKGEGERDRRNIAEIGFLVSLYEGYKRNGEPVGHPNILAPKDIFHFGNTIGVVLPLADTDLQHFGQNSNHNREYAEFFEDIALQILNGMLYIQSRDILNADYKEPNILLFKKGERTIKSHEEGSDKHFIYPCFNVAIADFGIALTNKCFVYQEENPAAFTEWWRAPELDLGYTYERSADVWAFGVILYQQIANYIPFSQETYQRLRRMIEIFGKLEIEPLIERYKSLKLEIINPKESERFWDRIDKFHIPHLKDLLTKIFIIDPKKRLTLKQVYDHPYFNAAKERADILPCLKEKIEYFSDDCYSLLSSRTYEPIELKINNKEDYITQIKLILLLGKDQKQTQRTIDLGIKYLDIYRSISDKPDQKLASIGSLRLASLVAQPDNSEMTQLNLSSIGKPAIGFRDIEWTILTETKIDIYKSTKIDFILYFSSDEDIQKVCFLWCDISYFIFELRKYMELVTAISCLLLAFDYYNQDTPNNVLDILKENQIEVENCLEDFMKGLNNLVIKNNKIISTSPIIDILNQLVNNRSVSMLLRNSSLVKDVYNI